VQKLWNHWEFYEQLYGISHGYNQIRLPKTQPPEAIVRIRLKVADRRGKIFSKTEISWGQPLLFRQNFHVLLFVVL